MWLLSGYYSPNGDNGRSLDLGLHFRSDLILCNPVIHVMREGKVGALARIDKNELPFCVRVSGGFSRMN